MNRHHPARGNAAQAPICDIKFPYWWLYPFAKDFSKALQVMTFNHVLAPCAIGLFADFDKGEQERLEFEIYHLFPLSRPLV